jgi:hypothetical protein
MCPFAATVDLGFVAPVPEPRFGDPEILGDLGDGLLTLPNQLDRASTKFRRVRSGHQSILPEATFPASGSVPADLGEGGP